MHLRVSLRDARAYAGADWPAATISPISMTWISVRTVPSLAPDRVRPDRSGAPDGATGGGCGPQGMPSPTPPRNGGEVPRRGHRPALLPDEKKVPTPADIGLTHKQVHEARTIRDAERAEP